MTITHQSINQAALTRLVRGHEEQAIGCPGGAQDVVLVSQASVCRGGGRDVPEADSHGPTTTGQPLAVGAIGHMQHCIAMS